jgi:hypothetical protein
LITGILAAVVLKHGFPQTQVIADEATIHFKREFPSWYFLKNYYLHELIIPHTDWDHWLKIIHAVEDGDMEYYYLFFKNQHLKYAAKTRENNGLESWVKGKFPDRPLQISHRFWKFSDQYNVLKEKASQRVF